MAAALGLREPMSNEDAANSKAILDKAGLAWLDMAQWYVVRGYKQRGQLLEVARSGDPRLVQAFVDGLLRRYIMEQRG